MSCLLLCLASTLLAIPTLAYNDLWGDHTGHVSSWPYGTGHLVNNTIDSEWYGLGGRGGDHCWTELWVVDHVYKYGDWQNLGDTDCKGKGTCQSPQANVKKECNSWSGGVSLTAKEEASLTDIFTIGVSNKAPYHYWENGCTGLPIGFTCVWKDQKCHGFYSRNVLITAVGYITRRCNKDGHQGEAVWGFDVNATAPTSGGDTVCDAPCGGTPPASGTGDLSSM